MRLWYRASAGSTGLRKVPEKVPEKGIGFSAEPGQVQQGPEKVHGAKPSQVQRGPEKVAGAGPGQVQHGQHPFQRLASQHASERFVK